jgi:steroid delta-isomerase-like uncharacterized protein
MGEALDVVNRFYEAFGRGDWDAADVVFDDGCRFVMPPGAMTKAEHKQLGLAFSAAVPDASFAVDHVLDGGDEVFVEGRFVGTHKADMVTPQGVVPASGNTINLRFADYFRVAGGRIVDHRTYWDQADMMAQLTASPG